MSSGPASSNTLGSGECQREGKKLGYRDNANATEHPEHQGDAALLAALLDAHLTAATVQIPNRDRGLTDREAAAVKINVVVSKSQRQSQCAPGPHEKT